MKEHWKELVNELWNEQVATLSLAVLAQASDDKLLVADGIGWYPVG